MKILIVGAGKLGYKLAEEFSKTKNDITVVDIDTDALERISDHLDAMVVKANGMQVEAMRELNLKSYNMMVVVTGNDETNMIICSICKKLGCSHAIARVRNPEFARQQDFIKSTFGIDYIVNPELATAKQILKHLYSKNSFYYSDFAEGRIIMVDYPVSAIKGFAGKKLSELELGNRYGVLIAAVSRRGEIIIPNGETLLQPDDIIYVIGKRDSINKLAKEYSIIAPPTQIKKAIILGGSIIGFYLAQRLASQGVAVKIIEQDKNRCEYLSEHLENALIIHGDGTDPELLEDEDVVDADAFIGATGYDEENLLMSLMMKQLGVKKVIAKVSRSSYIQIIEKLGVDFALNPLDITASDIIRYIKGSSAVAVSMLLGGRAQITEAIADEKMPIVGKTLAELNLPKGIIIGAIVHNGNIIVPNGSSVIYPGDRFVTMCLSSDLEKHESILWKGKRGIFQ